MQEYISNYKEIAIREMKNYGIPASIKMGQGILESAAGSSELAIKAKNHFGIKCKKNWTGDSFTYDDDEKGECFRKYVSDFDSYEDHSKFLKENTRYAFLFSLDLTDYKSWATGLKKAGYATNPNYAGLLIKTIEDYKLYELDVLTKQEDRPKDENKKAPEPAKEGNVKNRKNSSGSDLGDFTFGSKKTHVVKFRNNVKYIIISKGDQYQDIIREFALMPWELYKYNDLDRDASAKEGEVIYLQPKRRSSEVKSHTVKKGETLRDISQLYAVKLKRIKSLNELDSEIIKEGQTIRLK